MEKKRFGLVLSGGGARGAYQAGVIKGLLEIAEGAGNPKPFHILSGISAGAINATFLAANSHSPNYKIPDLVRLWSQISAQNVFRTDIGTLSGIGAKWIRDVTLGGFLDSHIARAFLDTKPLWSLLEDNISYGQLRENIRAGAVEALAITATDYSSSEAITFVQSQSKFESWVRPQRRSKPEEIRPEHVMASAAIPLFFPAINVAGRYFGDGCLRNTAPLSPAVHLGADKIVAIGVRRENTGEPALNEDSLDKAPSIGRVLNTILNAVILDSVHGDVERLLRINSTLSKIPDEKKGQTTLRPIDVLWVYPSEDIGGLARKEAWRLPKVVKYLLGGLGPVEDTSEIVSYLLFDPEFCSKLVEIGYRDALRKKKEALDFLKS